MKTFKSHYDAASMMTIDLTGLVSRRLDQTASAYRLLERRGYDVQAWRSKVLSEFSDRGLQLPLDQLVVDLVSCHPFYARDSGFAIASVSAAIALMKFNSREPDRILSASYLRGTLHSSYYLAKALEVVMSKSEAIELWKESVDAVTLQMPEGPSETVPSSTLFASSDSIPEVFQGGFDLVEYLTEDGRAGVKVNRCKWNEVIKETEDMDYAYAIACHFDFLAFRRRNPNFRLTRTQTLNMGASFCDFCVHDIRRHDPTQHPDETFWQEL